MSETNDRGQAAGDPAEGEIIRLAEDIVAIAAQNGGAPSGASDAYEPKADGGDADGGADRGGADGAAQGQDDASAGIPGLPEGAQVRIVAEHRDEYAAWGAEHEVRDSSAIPMSLPGTEQPIPVTIPILLAPGVKVVYTTRLGGVSGGDYASLNLGGRGGDDPAAIEANRTALAGELHLPLSIVGQVHSARVFDADALGADVLPDGPNAPFGYDQSGSALADGGAAPRLEADAQVTTRDDLALGIFAADCLPVLLADSEAGVIGACHCGRRGLQHGVVGATIDAMEAKGASRERIVATLGPCICGDCYEVGERIADDFAMQFPGSWTLSRFGGPGIDIAAAARASLAAAGVTADRLVNSAGRVNAATQYLDSDAELDALCAADGEGPATLAERLGGLRRSLCTLENPLWYSHRRAQLAGKEHEGRMLALVYFER